MASEPTERDSDDAALLLASRAISAAQIAKADAISIAEPIRERVEEVVRQEKAIGADKLQLLAHAIHGAAAGLDADLPVVARHVRDAGAWVEKSAGHVRDQNFEELFASVNDFARKNPAIAFAAAAFSGLALARFLKSTKTPST